MANKPKPITSVYLDIADFVWVTEEVLLKGESEAVKWLRDLRACLATRDASRSAYGAKLIEAAEGFREDARQRKAESRKRLDGRDYRQQVEIGDEAQAGEHLDEKPKRIVFIAPSVEDVVAFANENGLRTGSANDFCDFYESKGWKVGNVKMKDWKAAYRGWVRRDVQMPSAQEVQRFCSEKGVDQTKARAFYRELSSVGWKYRGQKIVDWKPLFLEIKP